MCVRVYDGGGRGGGMYIAGMRGLGGGREWWGGCVQICAQAYEHVYGRVRASVHITTSYGLYGNRGGGWGEGWGGREGSDDITRNIDKLCCVIVPDICMNV